MSRLIVLLVAASFPMLVIGQEQGSQPERHRDAIATRTLVEKAVAIKPGEPRKTVIDKLGAPDDDSVMMRKEKPEVIGYSLRYDIVRWKRGLVNELHDQYVDVYLDKANVVKSVVIRATLEGR